MIETSTTRAGVAGWPVEHSRSPMIHRYWLKELGLSGSYEKFAVRPGEFRSFADKIGEAGLVGANVTVPHKEAAFSACDRRTPVAEALGAVNTLWRQDGRLMGDNTDVAGFLANMDEGAPRWAEQGKLAIVIGAGGAARAIVYALNSRRFGRIAILNRTQARAEALAAHFGGSTIALSRADLAAADGILRARKCAEVMDSGVTIRLPETVVIDPEVTVGEDTVIEPSVQLLGRTRIGSECTIGAGSVYVSRGDASAPSRVDHPCPVANERVRQCPSSA